MGRQRWQRGGFFIHPTMLLEGPAWNADLEDEEMNESVDAWPIRHQASTFAGAGRVLPHDTGRPMRIFSLGDSQLSRADRLQDEGAFWRLEWSDDRRVLAGHSQGLPVADCFGEFFDGRFE